MRALDQGLRSLGWAKRGTPVPPKTKRCSHLGAETFQKERDMKTFINMLKDEAGASAAEYALILAVIGSVIAIAALGLANAVGGAMDDASTCVTNPTSANC